MIAEKEDFLSPTSGGNSRFLSSEKEIPLRKQEKSYIPTASTKGPPSLNTSKKGKGTLSPHPRS